MAEKSMAFAPTLAVVDGKAATTSTDVARAFGKQHGHVLRDIDNLCAQLPQEALSNFGEGSYTRPETGEQQHRMFTITRDGFTLLAMGFTGKKALQFKLAYIEAFNQMEAALMREAATPALDYQRISPAQAQLLKEIVHRIVAMGIQTFGETWARLRRKFKVNSYLQLPASRFNEAREYLLGKIPTPPQPAQLESVQTLVAKLAAQIEQGNSYPIQLFEPLIEAYHRRTGQRHTGAGPIPDEQAFDIELRLGRLARLFNPASEPFNDVANIARALGNHLPRLGHS